MSSPPSLVPLSVPSSLPVHHSLLVALPPPSPSLPCSWLFSHFLSKAMCCLTRSEVVFGSCTFTFEVSGQAKVSKRKRGSPGFEDRCALRKCWRAPSQLTGERSGFASSVPRTNVWTRVAMQMGKYGQAVSAKTRGGHQDRHPRVVEKERGPETRMRR